MLAAGKPGATLYASAGFLECFCPGTIVENVDVCAHAAAHQLPLALAAGFSWSLREL